MKPEADRYGWYKILSVRRREMAEAGEAEIPSAVEMQGRQMRRPGFEHGVPVDAGYPRLREMQRTREIAKQLRAARGGRGEEDPGHGDRPWEATIELII